MSTVQFYNAELVDNLRPFFQHRNEPNFAWKSAVSVLMGSAALRAAWPMSAVDFQNPQCLDVAGGGYHLTNNNSANFGYEQLTPYVDLDGTNQYLSRASAIGNWANILGTEAYIVASQVGLTWGGWFWFDALPGANQGLIGKYDSGTNNRSYLLFQSFAGALRYISAGISANGIAATFAIHPGALATGRFYSVIGRFVPSTSIDIYLDGIKATQAVGVPANAFDGAAAFQIGAFSGAANFLDGRASECFLCAAALSDGGVAAGSMAGGIIGAMFQQERAMFGI